jgi:hypothetical protein
VKKPTANRDAQRVREQVGGKLICVGELLGDIFELRPELNFNA